MTVKDVINQLSNFDENQLVRFYFLQGDTLNGCELETITQAEELSSLFKMKKNWWIQNDNTTRRPTRLSLSIRK
jgi:hypothetical protein